jgi:hypothetical protein
MQITFDMPQEQLEALEELRVACGLQSTTELWNNALTFFAWALNEERSGRVVASIDSKASSYQPVSVIKPADAEREGAESGGSTSPADDSSA